MTHDDFVKKNQGRYLEFPGTSSAWYQCMDLMRYYIQDVWGLNPYILPRASNAKSVYLNFKPTRGLVKIPNTPTGVPNKGDLIFWGTYPFITGLAGHVAALDSADVMKFVSFDQNWPTRTPCHLQSHSYKGVMGWIRKL